MSGNIKSLLVCIVILSIFGCAYLSAFSPPSIAQVSNGSRIYGHILDKNGHGVDHADVKLVKSDGYALGIPNNPAYSGNGKDEPYGFYEFNSSLAGEDLLITPDTYQVQASKDGHSASATITVTQDGSYSVDVTLSDYEQPSVTPVPTATAIPTALHHASVTVIEAPPTVIHHVATPDANATATVTQVPNATSTTASPTSIPPPDATPSPGSFLGTFTFSTFAIIGTMVIAAVSRKAGKRSPKK
ncbi:MAG TPA: hypothetical protein VGK13_01290 [Methanocellaceae archaeon]